MEIINDEVKGITQMNHHLSARLQIFCKMVS